MDTTIKNSEKTILLNLANKLTEAQAELDELTLQLALGKAEVRDKFEEIKMDFLARINHLKMIIRKLESSSLYQDILLRMDQLEKRLNFGVAESKENFVAQKRLIMKALLAVELEIKNRLPENLDLKHFLNDIENFKLKMEILRLKFALKRFTIKDEIKENAAEVRRKIEVVLDKAKRRLMKGEKRFLFINKDLTKVLT